TLRTTQALAAMACTSLLVFTASGPARAASVTLHWTAPGDDGRIGIATRYDIRRAFWPIADSTFTKAFAVPGPPVPQRAGTPESFRVDNLLSGITYFFAIRTGDDAGNWSLISNLLKVKAPGTVDTNDGPYTPLSFSSPWPNPCRATAS